MVLCTMERGISLWGFDPALLFIDKESRSILPAGNISLNSGLSRKQMSPTPLLGEYLETVSRVEV